MGNTLIFDRSLMRQRRDRAAAGFARHAVLIEEVAVSLRERLGDVKREFDAVLDIGGQARFLGEVAGRHYVAMDMSGAMLRGTAGTMRVQADEEFLPFAAGAFDLIVSNLTMQTVNDVPGVLAQVRRCLKPDGLFMATLAGGSTLHELHDSLMAAELAVTGGVSPRVAPMIDMPTASSLLQRAGFALPVVDEDAYCLTYPDLMSLMHELRGIGAGNFLVQRLKKPTRREVFAMAERIYRDRYTLPNGRLPASVSVIHMHGWQTAA